VLFRGQKRGLLGCCQGLLSVLFGAVHNFLCRLLELCTGATDNHLILWWVLSIMVGWQGDLHIVSVVTCAEQTDA
jgi:hypothetical protein